jgi:hypothetical protein
MGSTSYQSVGLKKAAWISKQIVIGTLLEKGSFQFPGSEEHRAQTGDAALSYFRIRVERTLKGRKVPAEESLRIFSSGEWFQHTHADLIRDGVVSFVDPHYSAGLTPAQLKPGAEFLFYLDDRPSPSGFPPGTVFLAFGEAYDFADREGEVLATLQEGPPGHYGQRISLQQGHRVRFPDGLEVALLAHSHKHPKVGGPRKEWIDLGLSIDGQRSTITLAHDVDADQKESWESRRWGAFTVEFGAISDAGEPVIVVRTIDPG